MVHVRLALSPQSDKWMSPPPPWTRRGILSAGVDSNSRIFISIASRVPYLEHAPWTRRGTLSAGVDACAPAWPGRPTAAAACRAAAATHMNSVRRLVTAARGRLAVFEGDRDRWPYPQRVALRRLPRADVCDCVLVHACACVGRRNACGEEQRNMNRICRVEGEAADCGGRD